MHYKTCSLNVVNRGGGGGPIFPAVYHVFPVNK